MKRFSSGENQRFLICKTQNRTIMANVHNAFIEFNHKIGSTPKKQKALKNMRRAIKADIKHYFKANGDGYAVRFKEQVCFSDKTTILPIDDEYDVGVYILGTEENRPAADLAYNWIINALADRKSQKAFDKKTSVRVINPEGYHVDIRLYYLSIKNNDKSFLSTSDLPKLAHKTKGWIRGDLYASKFWFEKVLSGKCQLQRIIRYLKAWSDNNPHLKLPNGILLSVLALNNYEYQDDDDKAFLATLKNIQEQIDGTRSIWGYYVCKRPDSDQNENLLDNYSSPECKRNFLDALDNMISSGKKAVEHESEKVAFSIWQKHLGKRFAYANREAYNEVTPQRSMLPWQLGFRSWNEMSK